jgi:hypothetical protein
MHGSSQILFATTVVASAVVAACGGGSGSDTGTLRLALTDAPACGFDSVFVTVDKVRVHKSGSANEGDDGWSEVVLSPPQRIDLLSLTNGALAELGQTPLPAGKYTQMRFVLVANGPSNPLANAVLPTGGVETPVATPSGAQSGLKMNVDIQVDADKVADFALDFETCRSFVQLGQGSWVLKPVIAVIPRISDAVTRVTGQVAPALALPTTSVSLQLGGVPVRSTPPDSTGKFILYPVPVGTYDLVVAAPGRATAVVTGVPVSATASTTVNPMSAPIDPPASPMHSAAGTVATGTTPIDAVVAARKSFDGGPQVTVARGPANGTTGAFALSLPSAAPLKTAYVPAAASLVFNTDTAVPTGNYTLAAIAGATTKTIDIDVTTSDWAGGVWTLP